MIFDHRTFFNVSFRIPMSKECSHYLSDKQNPYPYLREGPGSRLRAAKSIQPVNALTRHIASLPGRYSTARGTRGAMMWGRCMEFVQCLFEVACKTTSEFRNIKLYKVKQSERSSSPAKTYLHRSSEAPEPNP